MLVLSRRTDESIYIYPSDDLPPDMTVTELFGEGGIEVTILDTSRGHIKLGIDAPMMLNVDRDEILEDE